MSREIAAQTGRLLELLGEFGRREGFREDGATSLDTWAAEHCGVSLATARAWSHVAERLDDLPRLAQALSDGEVTFDKVRAVVDSATPETDEELRDTARTCSVRDLAALVRAVEATGSRRHLGPAETLERCDSTTSTERSRLNSPRRTTRR